MISLYVAASNLCQVKKLLPTMSAARQSENLRIMISGWVYDDSCVSTIGVERQHRINSESLMARTGRSQIDMFRFQATCNVAAHKSEHVRQGGQPVEHRVQRIRKQSRSQIKRQRYRNGKTKPTLINSGPSRHLGSGMIPFIAQKLRDHKALHPEVMPKEELKVFRQAAAAEWRAVRHNDSIRERCSATLRKTYVNKLLNAKEADWDQEMELETEEGRWQTSANPFQFGSAEWPLSVERLQEDFQQLYNCKVSDFRTGGANNCCGSVMSVCAVLLDDLFSSAAAVLGHLCFSLASWQ